MLRSVVASAAAVGCRGLAAVAIGEVSAEAAASVALAALGCDAPAPAAARRVAPIAVAATCVAGSRSLATRRQRRAQRRRRQRRQSRRLRHRRRRRRRLLCRDGAARTGCETHRQSVLIEKFEKFVGDGAGSDCFQSNTNNTFEHRDNEPLTNSFRSLFSGRTRFDDDNSLLDSMHQNCRVEKSRSTNKRR